MNCARNSGVGVGNAHFLHKFNLAGIFGEFHIKNGVVAFYFLPADLVGFGAKQGIVI